jgi:uncharacterized protein YndB with AHSA1/START domain
MIDTRTTREIDANPVAATLAQQDGRWVLTMQRHLRHEPAHVWRMLTVPEQLGRWSPVVPDRTLDSVGPATCRELPGDPPITADVLAVDALNELVHRWGDHVLRWTLEEEPGGTLLTLHHAFDERADASQYAGGWHLCLAALAAQEMHDGPERVVGSTARAYGWEELRDAYDASWA